MLLERQAATSGRTQTLPVWDSGADYPTYSAAILQCAWCGRIKGTEGRAVGQPMPLTAGSTHGICQECQVDLMSATLKARAA